MASTQTVQRGRVIGIGGVFFKSAEASELRTWYRDKLGIESGPEGAMFPWRSFDHPENEHVSVWSIFPKATKYFDHSTSTFMINYIVDDLEALLQRLEAQGVPIDPKTEQYDYGRFAWIYDCDGNKIELWEPPVSVPASVESNSLKNDSASE